jgi:hypothetical protein
LITGRKPTKAEKFRDPGEDAPLGNAECEVLFRHVKGPHSCIGNRVLTVVHHIDIENQLPRTVLEVDLVAGLTLAFDEGGVEA